MSSLTLFVLLGLGTGALTALLALGVVGEYKASGVVNFAHGAVAMFCAYCYTSLRSTGDLVLPVVVVPHRIPLAGAPLTTASAMAITCVYAACLGAGLYLAIFRWLRRAPALAKVVASIGLMLSLQALAVLHFGTQAQPTPAVLPNEPVDILGTSVGRDRIYLAAIAVVAALVLAGVYRFTRFGIVTRAVAQNERAASVLGWWPVRTEVANWAIASCLAGLAGVLAAPIVSLTPTTMTLAIVPALAAALVAELSSFTVAAAAALLIGVGQSLCVKAAVTWGWFPQRGMTEVLPFIVIAVMILLRGKRLPTRGESTEGRLPRAPLGARPMLPIAVVVPIAVVLLALTSGGWRAAVIQSIVTACVCLSLLVLTGFVGQVSLAQAAFAGVGGFMLAKLLDRTGVPFPVGLLFAGLVTVPIGLLVALPALRVRGINLAIITLGAGVAIDTFVFRNEHISGGLAGVSVPAPELFGLDLGINGTTSDDYPRLAFGLVAIATFAVLAVIVVNLRRSPTGSHCLAVRANERAASAIGINVAATKVIAFGLSAFIAGSAGGLIGYQQSRLSPESFSIFVSLMLLSITYIGGIATLRGVIFAGVMLAPGGLAFYALERWFELGRYQPLIAGTGVILSAILNPDGVTAKPRRTPSPLGARRPAIVPAQRDTAAATPAVGGVR
jgi:ABC-type branched-subunit amino acid transport system permease subunit